MDIDGAAYGSDKYGLVWAYLFAPGQPAEEIDADRVVNWLQEEPRESFLWLHFSLANTASARWMQSHLQLPSAFYDSLQEKAVSTRIEIEDATLVAVMHDVLFGAGFDASSVSSVSTCLEPRVLVSARRRPLRSVDGLRAAVKRGQVFRSSAELLTQLLREQANVLVDIVRQSTAKVDVIEDQLLADKAAMGRRELGAMRRLLVRLQRLLAPEPAALFRLLNRPPEWLGSEDVQDLRQAAEEFSTAVADAMALSERVKLLQEEVSVLINEQTNRTLFVLTVVTVMALPVNMIAGLFGMNVGGIPLSESRHGFAVIVTLLVTVTAVLAYFWFVRRRD